MLPARRPGRLRRQSRSPRWRELWQIPCFCLGLASCFSSLAFFHIPHLVGSSFHERHQDFLAAIDHHDLETARQLFQKLSVDSALSASDRAYLEGSLTLAEALQAFALPPANNEATETYARICKTLEQVLILNPKYVPPRLHYRLAVAKLGALPLSAETIDTVEHALDVNTLDRVEGYALIKKMRLLLSPPDYAGAMRALSLQLGLCDGAHQYPLRVEKAGLLAQLERWSDIPKAVSTIPVEAPEYPLALQWQAKASYQQKQWGEAVRLWSLCAPRDLSPQSLLEFGHSQHQLKNYAEARQLWERIWQEHLPTDEAVAAQCRLVELAQSQARWHDAVTTMVSLLITRKPASYQNHFVSIDQLAAQVTIVAERMIALRRWDDLRLLGEAAQSWLFAGKAYEWLSLSWYSSAEPAVAGLPLSQSSVKAYALSADFAWKAAQLRPAADKKRLLYQAGQNALLGKNYPLAQKALGELLSLNPEPKLRPTVLIGLAETLQEQKQYVLAADRLREALMLSGSHEAQARLRLAYLLLLEDKLNPEAGKQLEQAAALVNRPEGGSDARTACHRWATYLYNAVVTQKSQQILQAIDACEKALKFASPHPEAPQTKYLLAELLLADSRPSSQVTQTLSFDEVLRKQALQLWQACQYFQQVTEELKKPDAVISSTQNKEAFIRYARFGQAECWFHLGELRAFAPSTVPSADVCWHRAGDIYQSLTETSSHRVEVLWAYLELSKCQEKRGLFAEKSETLRDAYQQLQQLKDEELAVPSRFTALKRSQWELYLNPATALSRGQP